MSLRNHGPIQIFVTDTYVDVIMPFGFDALKQVIQRLGGKWVPDRKVYRILPQSAQAVPSTVETLESELKASSPEGFVNALSKIEALHVAARTSSFSFKGKDTDIREIGQKLNVGAVPEGRVRKEGRRRRITAQLNNISGG